MPPGDEVTLDRELLEKLFKQLDLGGHPKPAISGRLKTGHFR